MTTPIITDLEGTLVVGQREKEREEKTMREGKERKKRNVLMKKNREESNGTLYKQKLMRRCGQERLPRI